MKRDEMTTYFSWTVLTQCIVLSQLRIKTMPDKNFKSPLRVIASQ